MSTPAATPAASSDELSELPPLVAPQPLQATACITPECTVGAGEFPYKCTETGATRRPGLNDELTLATPDSPDLTHRYHLFHETVESNMQTFAVYFRDQPAESIGWPCSFPLMIFFRV